MPYVDRGARDRLDVGKEPKASGELNYLITTLVNAYLGAHPYYSDFNEVIGVLEAVKLELYRRRVAPYEDTKIRENGDLDCYSC